MIYSPTAFMKGSEIWLRYNERPEPKMTDYNDTGMYFVSRSIWQSSFREVKFHDQEAIRQYLALTGPLDWDELKGGGYIKLDALADRIEIINTCSCKLPTSLCPDKSQCDVHSVAVMLPEKTEPDESQEQLIISDETISQWAKEWAAETSDQQCYFEFGAKEMLKHIQKNFTIKRIEK